MSSANAKENWIKIDEFLTITGLKTEQIKELINKGQINAKYIDSVLYVDSVSGTNALVRSTQNDLVAKSGVEGDFFEQSIGTILSLHEKVIEAKDETIATIKGEAIHEIAKDTIAPSYYSAFSPTLVYIFSALPLTPTFSPRFLAAMFLSSFYHLPLFHAHSLVYLLV